MRFLTALVVSVSLLLAGCSATQSVEPVTVGGTAFFSMPWQVKIDRLPQGKTAEQLQAELQKVLDDLNAVLSTYQPDSELMRFNNSPVGQWVAVSPVLFKTVVITLSVSQASKGMYDITVGPLVNLWGFGPDAQPVKTPDDKQIAKARQRIGWEKIGVDDSQMSLMRKADVQLDLSSVGEGAAVDTLSDKLIALGIKGFMVSVAGCTRVQGLKADGKPWVIAIEKPDGSGDVQQILKLDDQIISTSGSYRNYREIDGVRYSHTINPKTGRPITHKGVSVSVVLSESTTLADAWATALNVLGPDEGYDVAEAQHLAAYFIRRTENGLVVRYTSAFKPLLPRQ